MSFSNRSLYEYFSTNDKRPVICEPEPSFPKDLATHINVDKGSMAYYDLMLLYKNTTSGKSLAQTFQSEETIEKDRSLI